MNQFNSTPTEDDDFKFRPLTEGLGFHKKNEDRTNTKAQAKIAFDASGEILTSPLPRKNFDSTLGLKRPLDANNTVDEILRTLNEKKSLDFVDTTPINAPVPATYKTTSGDFSACLLDAMLVTAASLLCLIILLFVTKVDLFANLYQPDAEGLVYISLIAMVSGITWIYLVGHRVFLGFTPGEWVFDQRLGKPEDMNTANYALKAIARSTIVLLTGFIVFPVMSLFAKKRPLGEIVGS